VIAAGRRLAAGDARAATAIASPTATTPSTTGTIATAIAPERESAPPARRATAPPSRSKPGAHGTGPPYGQLISGSKVGSPRPAATSSDRRRW
jgi:hypothetical protein